VILSRWCCGIDEMMLMSNIYKSWSLFAGWGHLHNYRCWVEWNVHPDVESASFGNLLTRHQWYCSFCCSFHITGHGSLNYFNSGILSVINARSFRKWKSTSGCPYPFVRGRK
jgi:hypothetical protein